MKGRIQREVVSARLTLPRVGFIKVGYKTDKGYPTSTDYFIANGKYESLFKNAYGEKPKTIQIVFTDDEPSKVCIEEYEYRDEEGRLLAKGDGATFEVWNGKQYDTFTTDKYPNIMSQVETKYPNRKVKSGKSGWDIVLTLNFIIPAVNGIVGYWTLKTKGELSTIPQIRETFDEILNVRGFVRGIIFDLSVDYAKSQKPDTKSKYPVITMIPNESEENINKLMNAMKRQIKVDYLE